MNGINAVSKVISQEIAREFPLETTEPLYEVADIFQRYGAVYRSKHRLIPQQYRAMRAIERCRTTALGAHVDACDHCAHIEISYNSCRNRHCPKCRGRQRQAWVDARELEVLPIQYFHLVFTLPQTLITLARDNPEHIYTLLLQSAAQTLQSFANKRWDASLGITLVLHTWGQTLNEHPHVHCIVTGGALRNDGCRFIRAPRNFLFPVKALSLVYRAKFLAGLETARTQGALQIYGQPELASAFGWEALRAALYQFPWVVYAKRPFAEPRHLIRYLGRYVNRVAIANHRIDGIDHGMIRFRYVDNRSQTEKSLTLTADEFIRRFLTHVLPWGYRRVRYSGFLVNSLRKAKLTLCRTLLGLPDPNRPYIADVDAYLTKLGTPLYCCPVCEEGTMKTVYSVLSFHDPPLYYQSRLTAHAHP